MAETVGTPGSAADSTGGGGPTGTATGGSARNYATKDKICPFCQAAFTSSSLGRHLDLYIRDKNPKPPDGIHDPDQIKDLRANITRRKNRKSSMGQRETSTPSQTGTQPPSASVPHPPDSTPVSSGWHATNGVSGPQQQPQQLPDIRMNEPSWEVTGVINGLPSVPREPRRDASSRSHAKTAIGNKQRLAESAIEQRALELALKEVLDSVKAATSRISIPSTFDFDPFELTFPALCLRLLSAPSTLFSSNPFTSKSSWSIEAPGPDQLEAVLQAVRDAFQRSRSELSISRPAALAQGSSAPPTPSPSAQGLHSDDQRKEIDGRENAVFVHVDAAYRHWKSRTPAQQSSEWTLEALRAFAKLHQSEKETTDRLSLAQQEVASLRQQVERLSACQAPREHLVIPPSIVPITSNVARDLSSSTNLAQREIDAEALVGKWRDVISREREGQSLLQQRPLPTSTSQTFTPQMVNGALAATSGVTMDTDGRSEGSGGGAEGDPDAMDEDTPYQQSPRPTAPMAAAPAAVDQGHGQILAPRPPTQQWQQSQQQQPFQQSKQHIAGKESKQDAREALKGTGPNENAGRSSSG